MAKQGGVRVRADVIAGEFRRMFQAAQEVPLRERGVRTGAVDPRRAARVVHGDGRIFQARAMEREPQTAGSLAICVSLQDLFKVQNHAEGDSALWRDSV